jgi:hypothetical protein
VIKIASDRAELWEILNGESTVTESTVIALTGMVVHTCNPRTQEAKAEEY